MKKEVTICDSCNRQIDKKAYTIELEKDGNRLILNPCGDICKECLLSAIGNNTPAAMLINTIGV